MWNIIQLSSHIVFYSACSPLSARNEARPQPGPGPVSGLPSSGDVMAGTPEPSLHRQNYVISAHV